MLATPVRVDRAVEADIGGIVARDDGARLLDDHLRVEGRRFVLERPAILEGLAPGGLETAGRVGDRAPSATAVRVDPRGWIDQPASAASARERAGGKAPAGLLVSLTRTDIFGASGESRNENVS